MKTIVIGAGGNLGRRLILRGLAHGHEVTAFVRNAARLASMMDGASLDKVRTVEGDASDTRLLADAMRGHDVAINAAGNAADGKSFVELFRSVVDAAGQALPGAGRLWALAGAAALDIPHYNGIGVGLPGVPKMYRPHERNWRALEASKLDWSLMCPGPMVASPTGRIRSDLRISIDTVPYPVPGWAGWAPKIALSLLMRSHLPELIVSYEDVADIIMSDLAPAGRFSRHRVGVALPAGERGHKSNWTLGQRGGDS